MSLRLLTFNIWFAPHEMQQRMAAIGRIIQRMAPDLIALQEMTAEHWQACQAHAAFRDFSWSPAARGYYYTLIGSRVPFSGGPARHPFESSGMDRDLLYGTVAFPGFSPLVFATVHLESLDRHRSRAEQVRESGQLLRSAPDVVVCGDTNINDTTDPPLLLPDGWQDAWEVLMPGSPGYTFDVERNGMVAQFDGWAVHNKARLRFDRFWTKLRAFRPVSIQLIDDPVSEGLWPSDHFGLMLTLEAVANPLQVAEGSVAGRCSSM